MKKFTKILIAAGIIGAAKYVYDHVEIKCNKVEKTKDIDKEVIDILREELKNTIFNDSCDHIYYDNPYNINKIHLDKDGCPMIFEFLTKEDRNMAFNRFCKRLQFPFIADCLGDDMKFELDLDDIFDMLGLIIDDYSGYKNDFVCWTLSDFEKANEENALPNTINFGEFERVVR